MVQSFVSTSQAENKERLFIPASMQVLLGEALEAFIHRVISDSAHGAGGIS